jgi:hypothetical protein
MRSKAEGLAEKLWGGLAIGIILFTIAFLPSDPEAEQKATQGPDARQRAEIVSRQKMSRAEAEMLRMYGWDREPKRRMVIVDGADGEPYLVEWRPAKH